MSLDSFISGDLSELLCVEVSPLDFSFIYGGLSYQVRYISQGTEGVMSMMARVGPLPYSTESYQARSDLQVIMQEANKKLDCAFCLKGSDLYLHSHRNVAGSLTSSGILGASVQQILPLLPYLELIFLYLIPPEYLEEKDIALHQKWRRVVSTSRFNRI